MRFWPQKKKEESKKKLQKSALECYDKLAQSYTVVC